MKRLIQVVMVACTLLTTAFAQDSFLRTQIPFDFVMAGKACSAGTYVFSDKDKFVTAKNAQTGQTYSLGFLPRIPVETEKMQSQNVTQNEKVRLSFAVSEGKRMLEAVWPARGAGYLVRKMKNGETRETVKFKLE